MDNRKRFFYNGAMLTAVGIAMRTVALFFNAFVTRTVGAEGLGLYTVVSTVYGFAVVFASSGISLTVTRLIASARGEGKDDEASRILAGAVVYAVSFGLAATLVLLFGADLIANRVLADKRAAASLRILAPSLTPLALLSVFSGYFVGIRRVGRNAVAQILGQLFKVGATVFLVVKSMPMEVEIASFMLSLGVTITEILCFLVVLAELLIERRGKKNKAGIDVGAVAAMALPLGFSAYIRQALITIEHILIPKRLRKRGLSVSSALSSYGVLHGMALPMILYPMVTLTSFSGLLVPEFAERSASGQSGSMRRLASKAFGVTLTYAILCSSVLFIFSEELGFIIYRSSSAGAYIAVLAPVVPIMYLDHVTDSVLKGIGEHVYSMWVNVTDAVLSIVLVWVLIPRLGIMGYALAIILMEAYNFSLSSIRLFKRIRFNISVRLCVIYPLAASLFSSFLIRALFISSGSSSTLFWLIMKLIFAVCAFLLFYNTLIIIDNKFIKKRKKETIICK